MKRLLVLVMLLLGLAFVMPAVSYAQFNLTPENTCDGVLPNPGNPDDPANLDDPDSSPACHTTGNDPISGEQGVLRRVLGIFSFVVGAASIIMLIFGGMKYISAGGDPTKLASARDTILYALIGGAVFISSQLIVRFVLGQLR